MLNCNGVKKMIKSYLSLILVMSLMFLGLQKMERNDYAARCHNHMTKLCLYNMKG